MQGRATTTNSLLFARHAGGELLCFRVSGSEEVFIDGLGEQGLGKVMVIKVAINGYGTIGKRVADAVDAQDDMEIVGVTKTRPSFGCDLAVRKGYPLYCTFDEKEKIAAFAKAGVHLPRWLDRFVGRCRRCGRLFSGKSRCSEQISVR